MGYFTEVSEYLDSHGLERPIGSSEQDIVELEEMIGFKLPKAYKAYLELMGQDYDGIMVGTNCFLSDVQSNNEYLPDLLAENGLSSYELPDNYLAFFCHQGYMMAWFSLPCASDDPAATYYFEGTTDSPTEFGLFSDFMKEDMLGNAKLRAADMRFDRMHKRWWQFWR